MQVGRVFPRIVLGLAVSLLVAGQASMVRAQSPFWRTALGLAAHFIDDAHERDAAVRFDGRPRAPDADRFDGDDWRIGRPAYRPATFSDDQAGLELAVLPRTGLSVRRVERGSPAQRAGLEIGDVLLRAGGVALNDRDDYFRALERGGRDRDGRELSLLVRDADTGRIVTDRLCLPEPIVDLCGRWQSDLGIVELVQTGDTLRGRIDRPGVRDDLTLVGHVAGNAVHFTWVRNDGSRGTGQWTITAAGRRLDGTLDNSLRHTCQDFDLTRC